MPLRLVRPAAEYLPSYVAALERGSSPDTVSPERTWLAQLRAIAGDAAGFLADLAEMAPGGTITLPDGREVARLPGFRRWMWDEDVCGSIGFRYQPGTVQLPAHVLGHAGYAVVPWRRGRGHATRALALLLGEIAPLGLSHVELTTDPDNPASICVIEANGGVLVERFTKGAEYGHAPALRFRIPLAAS